MRQAAKPLRRTLHDAVHARLHIGDQLSPPCVAVLVLIARIGGELGEALTGRTFREAEAAQRDVKFAIEFGDAVEANSVNLIRRQIGRCLDL